MFENRLLKNHELPQIFFLIPLETRPWVRNGLPTEGSYDKTYWGENKNERGEGTPHHEGKAGKRTVNLNKGRKRNVHGTYLGSVLNTKLKKRVGGD